MNKRNIVYVKERNTAQSISVAKNKYRSKVFFDERSIPVPQTFGYITTYQQLLDFDMSVLPYKFVVKPNKGSKGEGIMIVSKVPAPRDDTHGFAFANRVLSPLQQLTQWYYRKLYPDLSQSDQYFRVGDIIYSELDFKYACARILHGSYSLRRGDAILIEEFLVPHPEYKLFCKYGLADVRVIVFNRIPIAAMVRIPTAASGGKANIAQGGVACGIDIATGRINRLRTDDAVYTDQFPEDYNHLYRYLIPQWQEVLLYSSTVQYFSSMGYAGLDWVIGSQGPVLLEVNARPGLEIQNVTGIGLDALMSKVADLTVHTPRKGVEIATSLFVPQTTSAAGTDDVLYLSQLGSLVLYHDENPTIYKDVAITVDMETAGVVVSRAVHGLVSKGYRYTLKRHATIIGKDFLYTVSDELSGYSLVVGTDLLGSFVIKPLHTLERSVSMLAPDATSGDDIVQLQLLDERLYELSKKISLTRILKPLNYLEEFDTFIQYKGRYNPRFSYRFPSKKLMIQRREILQRLKDEYRSSVMLVSPFGQMLYDKMDELSTQLSLIQAYKDQNPAKIIEHNEYLYGGFDQDTYNHAYDMITSHLGYTKPTSDSQFLRGEALVDYIRHYLDDRDLHMVDIIFDGSLSSRIAIRFGKRVRVVLHMRASFDPLTIDATLAHEVDVHVRRFISGQVSGWHVLRTGTAGYLSTEEGLAVHRAAKVYKNIDPEYINTTIYKKYIQTYHGRESFRDAYERLQSLNDGSISYSKAFHGVSRIKQGVIDTSDATLAGWYKPKVYLDGYVLVNDMSFDERKKMLRLGKVGARYFDLFV